VNVFPSSACFIVVAIDFMSPIISGDHPTITAVSTRFANDSTNIPFQPISIS